MKLISRCLRGWKSGQNQSREEEAGFQYLDMVERHTCHTTIHDNDVDGSRIQFSDYYVFTPTLNPNGDFTPTFSHFVFLSLLFRSEASVYP